MRGDFTTGGPFKRHTQMYLRAWEGDSTPLQYSCLENPIDCSMPGFPVFHHLPELAQTHVHQVSDAIQPSHPLSSPFLLPQSFPVSGSFPMSQFFASDGKSFGASASASVLPMNIQDWFPLGLFSYSPLCPTLSDPMNCSTPGIPVHHHLPEFTQTHVHQVGDAIQPSHPRSSPSRPAPNPSQHQSLFQ